MSQLVSQDDDLTKGEMRFVEATTVPYLLDIRRMNLYSMYLPCQCLLHVLAIIPDVMH